MPDQQYHVELKGFDKLLRRLSAGTQDSVIKKSLLQSGWVFAEWAKANRLSGARPQFLGRVTSRLFASVQPESSATKIGDTWQIKTGTNVEYARIHEYGGTIMRYPRSSLRQVTRFKKTGSVHKKGQFKNFKTVGQGFTFGQYSITMPARPFLTPSVENKGNQMEVINIFTENINQAIRNEP